MPSKKSTTAIHLTGYRSGMLVARRPTNERRQRQVVWECWCDCGNLYYARAGRIRAQEVRSCGCREGGTIHGLAGTPAYYAIIKAAARCNDPKNKQYKNYGGRGIRICQRWLNPSHFVDDMGQPAWGLTIDRINNDGHYSCGQCVQCFENGWPLNVRWATMSEQNRNKRNTRWITAFGKTQPLVVWAAESNLPKTTISNRLRRGWSAERAVTRHKD